MNLLNTKALKVNEYKHLLIACTNDAQRRAPARQPGKPPMKTDSGKTSDDNSASLTHYRSDGADLLMCALIKASSPTG